ncbi:helix-turn-helix domain-containing protein [Euzebya tangerina]|uniref:helix-turn-helix domain-containing protein n=1 Tax=Euzebya tangerina TaxID=591198 RepID=UPI000E322C1E|nr:helix-turn-helix domain-containing protein [Euzebya tangerina]
MSGQVSIGRALGSTTRAGIYDHLRQVDDALTVRDVAATFDLHPNVARTHLGLLADAGLLSVGQRKHPGGGRPARIYRARADVDNNQVAIDSAVQPAGGAAAALMVRLLVDLLDSPGGAPLVARAHQAAREEGRQLITSSAGRTPHRRLTEASDRTVTALRAYAPEIRVSGSGVDWIEVDGLSDAVTLVERKDPVLAESIERGLLAGAFEAAGVPIELSATVGARQGRSWRLRASGARGPRSTVVAAASLDARGQSRDAGVVEAMRTITDLEPGDVLEVLAEGPGSPAVFARWADRAGHALIAVERAQDPGGRPAIRLLIEKARA